MSLFEFLDNGETWQRSCHMLPPRRRKAIFQRFDAGLTMSFGGLELTIKIWGCDWEMMVTTPTPPGSAVRSEGQQHHGCPRRRWTWTFFLANMYEKTAKRAGQRNPPPQRAHKGKDEPLSPCFYHWKTLNNVVILVCTTFSELPKSWKIGVLIFLKKPSINSIDIEYLWVSHYPQPEFPSRSLW
jgi:hypothetical protein